MTYFTVKTIIVVEANRLQTVLTKLIVVREML